MMLVHRGGQIQIKQNRLYLLTMLCFVCEKSILRYILMELLFYLYNNYRKLLINFEILTYLISDYIIIQIFVYFQHFN